MRFSIAAALSLLSFTAVSAQTLNATYVEAILGALTQANLTGLAGAAQSIANSTEGMAFLAQLSGSNKTLLAPSNDAFANVSSDVASNTTLLTQILSYHILNATVSTVAASPAHSIYRSLYNSGALPGNLTEPVVLTSSNATMNMTMIDVLQATTNATVLAGPVSAANFVIYVIDTVLTLPPTLSDLAGTLFPSLAGVIQSAGILEPLAAAKGLTVFAPIDSAIAGVASALGTLNQTQVQTVLGNHVINGSAVYSTQLTSSNYTSASGEPFTFTSNSSGTFVSSGASTAKIVQSDIIVSNGVIHLIDQVLVNPASDSTAAASAASSYAAAATATTATSGGGAVGSAPAGTSSAAASSSAATSGGQRGLQVSWAALSGMGIALAGVAAGAALVL